MNLIFYASEIEIQKIIHLGGKEVWYFLALGNFFLTSALSGNSE
jgi:hypothetical protein